MDKRGRHAGSRVPGQTDALRCTMEWELGMGGLGTVPYVIPLPPCRIPFFKIRGTDSSPVLVWKASHLKYQGATGHDVFMLDPWSVEGSTVQSRTLDVLAIIGHVLSDDLEYIPV